MSEDGDWFGRKNFDGVHEKVSHVEIESGVVFIAQHHVRGLDRNTKCTTNDLMLIIQLENETDDGHVHPPVQISLNADGMNALYKTLKAFEFKRNWTISGTDKSA